MTNVENLQEFLYKMTVRFPSLAHRQDAQKFLTSGKFFVHYIQMQIAQKFLILLEFFVQFI